MPSPKLSINRKTPLDSFDLAAAKGTKNSDGMNADLLTALKNLPDRTMFNDGAYLSAPPPAPPSSAASRSLPQISNKCPCPDERKLLVETAAAVAHDLLQKIRPQKPESGGSLPAATTSANPCPCVHCGGSRRCGPGCCCPCHGFFAPRTCAETMKTEADKERGELEALPEPPDPESITGCKPQQLRAGKFLTSCDCTKRNGLQHLCRRWGCSEKCPRLRPKQRTIVIGDPVRILDSTPRCCAGKMQAETYRMMEAKVDEMLKKPRGSNLREKPSLLPDLPTPPPFNWNGIFPHVCRQPGDECNRRPKPFPKMACNPGCKHWAVPRPCTYPICRGDCYEDPPPRPPPPDLASLALTVTPYLTQDTC